MDTELTIRQLQDLMTSGETTALQITENFLERIERLDKSGPRLNAIIEINPDALQIAGELDQERKKKGARGPLHGIPVMLKDNIDTADRMTTTAGSLALEGHIAARDAHLVRRLRRAGAVILAKTNLSEWANFRSEHSTSGWSSRGGQTRNPYALDRNPCGSSSGSAVAVAANLCAAAIGTETDGSIVCPSHANGVVGIKPTLGLVSRSGIIPIAHSQDTAGPIARTVEDAALLLHAIQGADKRDPATIVRPAVENGYAKDLRLDYLKGRRIGVARNYFGFHPLVDAVIEECLETMKDAGAVIVDPADLETEEKFGETEYEVLLYEFKHDLNAYLSKLGPVARVHSMEEIIAFNEQNKERVMPYFGQERMLKAQEKGPLTDNAYLQALQTNHRLARLEGIDAVMDKHQLDTIVAPTGGPAWLTDWVNGDHYGGGSSSYAAVAGYPNISVPAGFVQGLPVGISFFAGQFQDAKLIRLANAFEQARGARRPPEFKDTLQL